jgi:CRP/FNR family transcriptional regulator
MRNIATRTMTATMPGVPESHADMPAWPGGLTLAYPALAGLPALLPGAALWRETQAVEVPAGSVLFEERAPCSGFPLVLEGEVRVARGSAQGRSLELYRVGPGELCVVSACCLFGSTPLSAHGVTTLPTRLLLLSPAGFERWVAHEPFRRFVFGVFADRLGDLMTLAEAVAFQRLDQRLAATLLGHGPTVHATHQALADELGTVREIVTRLLKRFERAGWVSIGRERIELHDAAALRAMAAGDATAR